MKLPITLSLLLFVSYAFSQAEPILIGEKVQIENSLNGEKYNVLIHKTHGYHLTNDPYPVLYLLDGEWHFPHTSALVDYYAAAHGGRKIPPIIVVAIENNNRGRDLTPTDRPQWAGGKADEFLDFLEKDVFPYVEKNYRAAPFRILTGHSLAAQFSLYSLSKRPDLFNAHFSVSPWFEYDENWLVENLSSLFDERKDLNAFVQITVGGDEKELIEGYGDLKNYFEKQGVSKKQSFEIIENTTHETTYLPALTKGLLSLFDSWYISRETRKQGIEAIEAHYEKVSKDFGYAVMVPEYVLNEVGYYFMAIGEMEDAYKTLMRNKELYPKSANVFDSLGDYYDKMEEPEKAYEHYKKALEIGKPINHASLKWFEANVARLEKQLGKK